MRKPSILIVDTETRAHEALRLALRRGGFTRIGAAATAASAIDAIQAERPSVVVVDDSLPDASGLDLADSLRRLMPDLPLVLLSDQDDEGDVLRAFAAGADDYVTKPYSALEVVARVKALLRRVGAADGLPAGYDFGRFSVFPAAGRLLVEGRDVSVPARELKLLAFLARHEGHAFATDDLYRLVWNAEPLGPSDRNTVSVHVRRLRERIERDPTRPEYLLTLRCLGYKLTRPDGT